MKTCQRCGSDDVSWTADQVQLIGGVTANLCAKCITEFDGVLCDTPEWAEIRECDSVVNHQKLSALARQVIPLDEVRKITERRHVAERAIRLVTLEFVKPLVPVSV